MSSKRFTITLYIILSLIGILSPVCGQAQLIFRFDRTAPLKDNTKTIKLNLAGRLPSPELVKGIAGDGLRTDGYSTYASLKVPSKFRKISHINGYFALETYPTDTAGFFTLYQALNETWIAACIDQFGTPMLAVSDSGKLSYFPAKMTLQKFKWINVGLACNSSAVQLIINGNVVCQAIKLSRIVVTDIDSLEIGKSGTHKHNGIFPVNFINGIIDEVEISSKPFSRAELVNNGLNGNLKESPVLAIPSSRFNGDFTRPEYHLLPAANWTNETHALLYYNGLYHIFNQKNGANLFLGQINWGHFTSPDLIHWTEHKPILSPQPGYDQNGIWSGCSVLDENGTPNIFYSSSGPASFDICRALPDDKSLMSWNKPFGNPVISSSPKQYSRNDFHDPYVWKDGPNWYMIVGFGLTDENLERGAVLLYRSADLKNWTYLHPLFSGNPVVDNSGVFWEMPVFYKMGSKYVLLVNKVPHKGTPAKALYWTGSFVDEKFVPDDPIPRDLEVINRLLSPSVTQDVQGHTVAIAIIPDETSAKATYNVGWTHLYSIPRIWTLENGKICQQPYPTLEQLREKVAFIPQKNIISGDSILLTPGQQQMEISVNLIPDGTGRFGFIVGKNPSGSEYSKIYYDFDKQELVVDQTKSSTRKYIPLKTRVGKYLLTKDKKVNFHLFFDGSVIEGFINNEDAFTTRLFPESAKSTQVEIFSEGGNLELLDATIWKLKGSENKTDF